MGACVRSLEEGEDLTPAVVWCSASKAMQAEVREQVTVHGPPEARQPGAKVELLECAMPMLTRDQMFLSAKTTLVGSSSCLGASVS